MESHKYGVEIYFSAHEGSHPCFHTCSQILKELHKSCQRDDGTDDQKKGTQLLEVYAIEIQMYTETKNNKKLKVSLSVYWVLVYFGHEYWSK